MSTLIELDLRLYDGSWLVMIVIEPWWLVMTRIPKYESCD